MARVTLSGQVPDDGAAVTIDFDAWLEEHDDAEPLTIRAGGRVWNLPASLPAGMALRAAALEVRGKSATVRAGEAVSMLRGVFGAEQAADLLDCVPGHLMPDLLEQVLAVYAERAAQAREARQGNGQAPAPNRAARRGGKKGKKKRPASAV